MRHGRVFAELMVQRECAWSGKVCGQKPYWVCNEALGREGARMVSEPTTEWWVSPIHEDIKLLHRMPRRGLH